VLEAPRLVIGIGAAVIEATGGGGAYH
jgi:hypothetical protein